MKKLIVILMLSLFLFNGCISGTVAGYGVFDVDSGVRIMKDKDSTVVIITYKQGDGQPEYEAIAKILNGAVWE